MKHAQLPYSLKIGRKSINVRDLSDASFAYQDAREMHHDSGELSMGNGFPDGSISLDGKQYRIAYDGSVWLDDSLVLETQ